MEPLPPSRVRKVDAAHRHAALRRSGTATRPVPMPNSSAAPSPASRPRKSTVGSITAGCEHLGAGVVVARGDALAEVVLALLAGHARHSTRLQGLGSSLVAQAVGDHDAKHRPPALGPIEHVNFHRRVPQRFAVPASVRAPNPRVAREAVSPPERLEGRVRFCSPVRPISGVLDGELQGVAHRCRGDCHRTSRQGV